MLSTSLVAGLTVWATLAVAGVQLPGPGGGGIGVDQVQLPAPSGRAAGEPLRAIAELRTPDGTKVGTVLFQQLTGGVKIKVVIDGLPPGVHGFHIHNYGSCEVRDFRNAGGHFNPQGEEHGFLNPNGPHAGDLPNLVVGADGTATMEFVSGLISLNRLRRNSLLRVGGTSAVVDEGPDDYLTEPAGEGGARIACGVIKQIMD
jgi:Cu-Zn family superoxide dismutase